VLTTASGEKWQVQIARNGKLQVLGSATTDVLQPGQFIAFSAQVDKRRATVQDKVAKLKIFTPSEHQMVGAFPAQGAVLAAGGLGGALGVAPKPAAADAVEEFEIGARIVSMKKGKFSLYAPNPYFRPALEIELADEPEISLDVADPRYLMYVKKGDKIEARGTQVGPNAAQVNEVIIELAEPLGSQQATAGKRSTRRTTRSSRRAPAQAEEEADEKAADAGEKAADASDDEEEEE
jgi:hypothetical protein